MVDGRVTHVIDTAVIAWTSQPCVEGAKKRRLAKVFDEPPFRLDHGTRMSERRWRLRAVFPVCAMPDDDRTERIPYCSTRVKFVSLIAWPNGVVTVMRPVVAVAGTRTLILSEEIRVI